MTDWTKYFAYGSNLSLAQITKRCPGHRVLGKAVAKGWALHFPLYSRNWGGGVANIQLCDESEVEGVLYELHAEDEQVMDGFEVGYNKGELEVEMMCGMRVQAMSYFAVACPRGPYEPTAGYVETMLAGGADHGLSEDWVRAMRERLRVRAE